MHKFLSKLSWSHSPHFSNLEQSNFFSINIVVSSLIDSSFISSSVSSSMYPELGLTGIIRGFKTSDKGSKHLLNSLQITSDIM